MADVAEEDGVIAACSSLLVADLQLVLELQPS